MADDLNKPSDPPHELPLPEATRGKILGRQLAHPAIADAQKPNHAFADPNLRDDARLGKAFEESNSSRKKQHAPIPERVQKPKNRKMLYLFVGCAIVLFLVILVLGWLPRHARDKEIRQDAAERAMAIPVVETAAAKRAAPGAGLVVPRNAVAIRNDTTVVFTVAGNQVHMVPVALGREYGPVIEVLSGLRDGDVVVTNVADDIYEGATVRVHETPSQQTNQAQPPGAM